MLSISIVIITASIFRDMIHIMYMGYLSHIIIATEGFWNCHPIRRKTKKKKNSRKKSIRGKHLPSVFVCLYILCAKNCFTKTIVFHIINCDVINLRLKCITNNIVNSCKFPVSFITTKGNIYNICEKHTYLRNKQWNNDPGYHGLLRIIFKKNSRKRHSRKTLAFSFRLKLYIVC